MKVIRKKLLPNGGHRITLDVLPGETLVGIAAGGHFRLGGQLDDVVAGHVIAEMRPVYWCSINQEWVDQ